MPNNLIYQSEYRIRDAIGEPGRETWTINPTRRNSKRTPQRLDQHQNSKKQDQEKTLPHQGKPLIHQICQKRLKSNHLIVHIQWLVMLRPKQFQYLLLFIDFLYSVFCFNKLRIEWAVFLFRTYWVPFFFGWTVLGGLAVSFWSVWLTFGYSGDVGRYFLSSMVDLK